MGTIVVLRGGVWGVMQAQGKAVGELCKHTCRRDDLKVQGIGIKRRLACGMWA